MVGARGMGALIEKYRAFSGSRVAVLGSGEVALATAKLAIDYGIEVAGIVEQGPTVRSPGPLVDDLIQRGVNFYTGHRVVEARGQREVEALVISSGDYSLEIAAIPFAWPWELCLPVGLPYLTGCELRFDGSAGGYAPAFNSHMQTSIEGVFVAGDVCGIADEETAKRQGLGLGGWRRGGRRCSRVPGRYTPEWRPIRGWNTGSRGEGRWRMGMRET